MLTSQNTPFCLERKSRTGLCRVRLPKTRAASSIPSMLLGSTNFSKAETGKSFTSGRLKQASHLHQYSSNRLVTYFSTAETGSLTSVQLKQASCLLQHKVQYGHLLQCTHWKYSLLIWVMSHCRASLVNVWNICEWKRCKCDKYEIKKRPCIAW